MSKARPKTPKRRPAPPTRRRTRRTAPIPELPIPPIEETVIEPAPTPESTTTEADVLLSVPEPAFASRVPPPEPDRPLPPTRRAIFFDVENTSRAEHIARMLDHLAVDRMGKRTEFVAVGNWKVIGSDTARLMAHHGAHLVHSAPSTGVRDWSDLRIAVSAGVWLAAARPGDILEVVSDDRAFDAVGDVAAGLGIAFRRLSYRVLLGSGAVPAPVPVAPAEPAVSASAAAASHRRRHGRGGRRWRDGAAP
ncbi:MAG: hypothetical protein HYU41_25610, partial [Candidatus Rokubacteria bacterium]|nr:hypothetical protein [Candidatus Rokubacteria bacterium]